MGTSHKYGKGIVFHNKRILSFEQKFLKDVLRNKISDKGDWATRRRQGDNHWTRRPRLGIEAGI